MHKTSHARSANSCAATPNNPPQCVKTEFSPLLYIVGIMSAEGIHYVVLRLDIVLCSKDVFDTEYQDFMNCCYINRICRKHDTELLCSIKLGNLLASWNSKDGFFFFHGVSLFNRLLTFGSDCNSFTPYLDLTTSDFFPRNTKPFHSFTDPCNNSLIIRISNLRPISRSKTLLPFFFNFVKYSIGKLSEV